MRTSLILLIAAILCPSAFAAELQLRAKCQPRGPIVTLGDIAEIHGDDARQAEALASVELFPAPAPGQQRVLRSRELQDLMAVRSTSFAEHRLSGANQTVIVSPTSATESGEPRPLNSSTIKRSERLAREAIEQYLREQVGEKESWNIQVSLSEKQARAIPADCRGIVARGGQSPWTGKQEFELRSNSPTQPVRIPVTAEVAPRAAVVVAVASIARGAVIRPNDVELRSAGKDSDQVQACHAMEEVIGQEAARAIAPGAIFVPQMVRSPVLVRRGDPVTVYVHSGGVRVRVTARAKQDGAIGDLVTLESPLEKKGQGVTARVTGLQEAEVYARAIQANPTVVRGGFNATKDEASAQDAERDER